MAKLIEKQKHRNSVLKELRRIKKLPAWSLERKAKEVRQVFAKEGWPNKDQPLSVAEFLGE